MTPIPKSLLLATGAMMVVAVGILSYVLMTRLRTAGDTSASIASSAPLANVSIPQAPDVVAPVAPPFGAVGVSRPQFDVVRVEPTGDTVVAGRAEPNSTVFLMNKGEKVAEAKADAGGQFVILPPAFAPGDHLLTLRSSGSKGEIESEQNVTTSVPRRAGDKVVAALSSPDQPTRLLNDAGKTPLAAGGVAIASAEAGEDGSFLASGVAEPGASIRLYLNNSFVAPVQAGRDGKWSLKIGRGMLPGHYDIRADSVDSSSGKVIARAGAPFDYPDAKAIARAPVAPPPRPVAVDAPVTTEPKKAAPTQEPGQTIVAEIQSVTVERGDSLWRISRKVLGSGVRYTQIYEANAGQIRDPNRIWPGQVFVAPKSTIN